MKLIKIQELYSLANSTLFHEWLKENAPDIYETMSLLSEKGNIGSIMRDIYRQLREKNLEEEFIKFTESIFKISKPNMKVPNQNKFNKHKVFKYYNPQLLTFPRKCIIKDSPEILKEIVAKYKKIMMKPMFLIIDDYLYIEYFRPQDTKIVEKFSNKMYEIYNYNRQVNHNLSINAEFSQK